MPRPPRTKSSSTYVPKYVTKTMPDRKVVLPNASYPPEPNYPPLIRFDRRVASTSSSSSSHVIVAPTVTESHYPSLTLYPSLTQYPGVT